nr:hypothetical protein [Tanacetum cinerariifolium]
MNQHETQQVIASDEKWVPSADRVKISSTNLRLETTVPQKEETFQKRTGKGSLRKNTIDDSQETIDVSKESEPEHEHVKKKTTNRRVVKKKVLIFADDNIFPDLDVALELGNYISLAKAKVEEAANAPKPKPATSKPKLKGVQSLTPTEKEATDIMQALKESKKTSKRQPGTKGSSEGAGTIPWVLDESTFVSATSYEQTEIDWINSKEDDEKKNDHSAEGHSCTGPVKKY